MPRGARLELATDLPPVHLEPYIDANRTERRLIAKAEAHRAAKLAEVELGHPLDGVASLGESVRGYGVGRSHSIERVAADAGVASGEKALARRQILDQDRVAVLVDARARKTIGKTDGR